MDIKKKIVIVLGILVGIAFLYVGFNGLQEKKIEAENTVNPEGVVDENSADALGNIQ